MARKKLPVKFSKKERRWLKHTCHDIAREVQVARDPNKPVSSDWFHRTILSAVESMASSLDLSKLMPTKKGKVKGVHPADFIDPEVDFINPNSVTVLDPGDHIVIKSAVADDEEYIFGFSENGRPYLTEDFQSEPLWSDDSGTIMGSLTAYEMIVLCALYGAAMTSPEILVENQFTQEATASLIKKGLVERSSVDGLLGVTEEGERRVQYALCVGPPIETFVAREEFDLPEPRAMVVGRDED